MTKAGTLFLVATPIGNLEDITFRALKTLKEVDVIAAEDTRQTLKLLNHYGIKASLTSYYEHNKVEKGNYIIQLLLEGKNVAVVSDAGSPGISDPGEDLVRLAVDNGIDVTMIPGPVAAITGLVISGLPTGRFVFEGFLPMNKRQRRERLEELKNEVRTIVLYEAPHKLIYTLNDLYNALGDRRIVIARELTKKFEQVVRCTLSEAISLYSNESPKGEFVLVLEGADKKELIDAERKKWDGISLKEHVDMYMEQGFSRKESIKKVAEDRGLSKREVYNSLIMTEE